MTTTTHTLINQRTNTYAQVEMLAWAQAVVVLSKFGMSTPIPKNKADNAKWRRIVPFSAATTPLVEGVTPTAQQFQYEDVSATLNQYGVLVEFTDWAADLVEDPVFNDCLKAVADQMAKTIEAVTWGVVRAGTNVYRANGAARTAINTPFDQTQQRAITRFLNRQKAEKISRIQNASPDYGTRAIWAAYVGMSHTDMEHDLLEMPSFIPIAEYGTRSPLSDQEIGACENVRWVLSADLNPFTDAGGTLGGSGTDMVSTSGTSADVYPAIITGKDAYGVVPLKGRSAVEPIMIPVNQKDKADPLGQRGYVGAKHYFTAVRLNESWMARAESAVTALA